MSLQYIIDGYNIANHALISCPGNRKNIQPYSFLASFIISKRLTGSSQNKVAIVFDGYPIRGYSIPEAKNLEIIFSRRITADEKIKQIVESLGNRHNLIVVSNDRQLQFAVKALGSRFISIEEFVGRQEEKRRQDAQEAIKPELNFTQIEQINRELRKLWLKE
ncbi:MAG: NYN domain-containing protein [Candidatus Omnitrophica bacterium]|nr:NYN domain-containing protein [Candidatus Omnitrophota bacterium]